MSETPSFDPMQMTGLEIMRAFVGLAELPDPPPSIGRLLGMRIVTADEGSVTFTCPTKADFANPMGTTHGGICATMLDSAMGCAVHTTLGPGDSYATLELSVNYVRGVPIDGVVLTATGSTIHVGRRSATAEGRVLDDRGRLVAHGTTTCMITRAG